MLISLCIPIRNRLSEFKRTMPQLMEARLHSQPCQICVLDYGSTDGLGEYLQGVQFKVARVERDHYHMAKARNLSVLMADGEYIVILSADIYITNDFLPYVRSQIEQGKRYQYDQVYRGVIVLPKHDFMAVGGYDERFEFYGPEDKDMHRRLVRYGLAPHMIPAGMVGVIPTPDAQKINGYRLQLSKEQMHRLGKRVLQENDAGQVVQANPEGWGRWN